MDDNTVSTHIEELVAEEHKLLDSVHGDERLSPEQRVRLDVVREQLDRYWDLLRQRRAQEEFGLDPDATSLRPTDTVEGYQQ